MIKIDFTTKSEIIPEYVVDELGAKRLFDENGLKHSYNDLPAVVMQNGSKHWYKHGERHRDNDLPAIVLKDGNKYWYKHDKVHRDNGLPAIVLKDGNKYYWVNDIFIR